jgi:chemotaxis protein methyltransferase CheR
MNASTKMALQRSREMTEGLASDIADHAEREFEFSDADFRSLVQLAHAHTGIALADSKRNLVYGRLSRRLRALKMSSFREYREFLQSPDGEVEIEGFINSISTNLTKLFRESHHFDHFRTNVAASFARSASSKAGSRLRIWSAGCSTGEEPYTIAMVLRREVPTIARHDARILATDIDTEVLQKGAQGEYPATALQEAPATYREFMQPANGNPDSALVVMDDELKALISFKHLNLMKPWPFKGPFDAIFCRNVMIYFDGPTKAELIERFVSHLKPGGWLYIGHSESLLGTHQYLQLVGRTIYRRTQ